MHINLQPTLTYKTEEVKMSRVVFESMVNNLGDRIRRMNFELHFNSEGEKTAFLTALQREREREENEDLLGSDEEKNADAQDEKDITNVLNREGNKLDSIVIEETFEKSILLREKFMDKLKSIGDRLNVIFMVVPNKVKISGIIRDRVDQAQEEYREIQESICFEPIDKYGQEVYQSKFFKDYLKEKKVQVIQILRKYYFWFIKDPASDPIDVINEVFQQTKHASYPLRRYKNTREAIVSGKGGIALGEIEFARNQEKITDRLFVCVRSRIFEKYISKKFNLMEDRKKRQVELSEDRKALILHMDAEEQLTIQRESLDEEYNHYNYLFFIFNEKVDMNQVSQSFENANINDLIWEKENSVVCLSFARDYESLNEEKIVKHPLMKLIAGLPSALLDFKLGIFDPITLPEQPEWIFMISERDRSLMITTVGVKSMLRKNFEKMIRLYIENKLTIEYLLQVREKKLNTSSTTVQDISIDFTRPINESTQFLENHFDNTMFMKKEVEKAEEVNATILNSQTVLKINFRFENYDIFLRETEVEREKKFVEKEGKIEIGKIPMKNQSWDQLLHATTSFKFKCFRIKISQAFRIDMQKELDKILAENPELARYNRWVTVFVGAKDNNQFESLYNTEAAVKITKLEKNYKIKEGYMISTNALFIFLAENEELPFGRYQATCWVRKIQ